MCFCVPSQSQYIIPLAKKLKDCGVFGVSSDEYLNCKHQRMSINERLNSILPWCRGSIAFVDSLKFALLFILFTADACKNRQEWEREGKAVVASMVERFRDMDFGDCKLVELASSTTGMSMTTDNSTSFVI